MYNKILVPMALDHDISAETMEIARNLLADGGEITGLHVMEATHGSVSTYLDEETPCAPSERANPRSYLQEKTAGLKGRDTSAFERSYRPNHY